MTNVDHDLSADGLDDHLAAVRQARGIPAPISLNATPAEKSAVMARPESAALMAQAEAEGRIVCLNPDDVGTGSAPVLWVPPALRAMFGGAK